MLILTLITALIFAEPLDNPIIFNRESNIKLDFQYDMLVKNYFPSSLNIGKQKGLFHDQYGLLAIGPASDQFLTMQSYQQDINNLLIVAYVSYFDEKPTVRAICPVVCIPEPNMFISLLTTLLCRRRG